MAAVGRVRMEKAWKKRYEGGGEARNDSAANLKKKKSWNMCGTCRQNVTAGPRKEK